jgi:hypothetical protein
MEQILNLLAEYKWPTVGIGGFIALFWPKIISFLKSIKLPSLPSFSSDTSSVSPEEKDQESLRHLRDRAVSIGDKELLQMIRNVDSRFFDIHISEKVMK